MAAAWVKRFPLNTTAGKSLNSGDDGYNSIYGIPLYLKIKRIGPSHGSSQKSKVNCSLFSLNSVSLASSLSDWSLANPRILPCAASSIYINLNEWIKKHSIEPFDVSSLVLRWHFDWDSRINDENIRFDVSRQFQMLQGKIINDRYNEMFSAIFNVWWKHSQWIILQIPCETWMGELRRIYWTWVPEVFYRWSIQILMESKVHLHMHVLFQTEYL